jgi:hypothetical protein
MRLRYQTTALPEDNERVLRILRELLQTAVLCLCRGLASKQP